MSDFEEWFDSEYHLPTSVERGPIGRDFKKGCKKAYEAGHIAGNNAGYAEALIDNGIEGE